jgi:protein TonB
MKFSLLFITTSIIIFVIYLGMATITMMPPTQGVEEENDVIDIFDIKHIKTKPLVKSKTQAKPTSLNVKPNVSDHLNIIKTQLFSSTNNKLIKQIDMKDLVPISSTDFHNDLVESIDKDNLESQVLKPLYPYQAYQNNINGWVVLKLFISKIGKVVDAEVLDSNPRGVFENVAIKTALKKEYPIDKNILDPKAYTKNINIKFNVSDQNLL